MSYFDTIAPQLAAAAFQPATYNPLAGVPMLPKSNSNFNGAAVSPTSNPVPVNMLNALTQMQSVAGENQLRGYQAQQLQAQVGLLQQAMKGLNEPEPTGAGTSGAPGVNAANTSADVGSPAPAASANIANETNAPAAISDGTSSGGENWEVKHNNFAGMRIPGVNAGPNSGGFQSFATPEEGIGAISHQLDRYASGATTGSPLTTLRQIIGTWAPPSENDTGGLIQRASTIMGVNPDTPLNLANPAVKAQLVEAMVRNEQGGNLPANAAKGISSVFANANWAPYSSKPTQLAQASTGTATDATPISQGAWSALGGAGAPPQTAASSQGVPTASAIAPGGGVNVAQMTPTQQFGALAQMNPAQIQWAQRQDMIDSLLGRRNPSRVDQILSFAPGGANDPNTIFRKGQAEAQAQKQTELQYAPQIAAATKQAEMPFVGPQAAAQAAGTQLFVQNPDGSYSNAPGSLQATQNAAQAKSEGEEQPKRVTQAVAPQTFRGAGSGTFYPPGSPAAPAIANIPQNGQPEGTAIHPTGNGGVTVENTNPSSETIGKNFETLDKMGETADAARSTLYQAKLLQDRLNAIGTSGPLTQHLGDLGALAKQVGVPDATLNAINIPSAPTVQEANAISLELLGSILRQTFPTRITNTDIGTFKPSNPNVSMLGEASNYLINNIVVPKAQRDIERYGAATTLPQSDPQAFKKQLFDWDQAHPYEGYAVPTQAPKTNASQSGMLPEGMTATGPNGHQIINHGGQLFDVQTRQPFGASH